MLILQRQLTVAVQPQPQFNKAINLSLAPGASAVVIAPHPSQAKELLIGHLEYLIGVPVANAFGVWYSFLAVAGNQTTAQANDDWSQQAWRSIDLDNIPLAGALNVGLQVTNGSLVTGPFLNGHVTYSFQ